MNGKKTTWRFLVMLIILALIIPAPTDAAAKAGSLRDISGHWAENYINKAIETGIVSGYPDNTFQPDRGVTRAEFASMVNKALEISNKASISFDDVSSRDWYYDDVAKAIGAAYASGYADSTFKPNAIINRQEAAVMLARLVPSSKKPGKLTKFADSKLVANWAQDALSRVNEKGYIGPYNDGRLHPTDQLTRAQTAKIISDYLQKEDIVRNRTTLKKDGDKLSGGVYVGDVIVDENVKEGKATVENCIVLGNLYLRGGGKSVTLSNCRVANAIADRGGGPLTIIAKGQTVVVKLSVTDKVTLQASSLTKNSFGSGFDDVSVKTASTLILKGTFPLINLDGSRISLTLESGTVDYLNVTPAGKFAYITAAAKAVITEAEVNAPADFRGEGTITHMYANTNDISYEKRPKNWTIGSHVDQPVGDDEGADNLDIVFKPKPRAVNVDINTQITLTFPSAIRIMDGSAVKDTDISDFVLLRENTKNGREVKFKGTLSGSNRVITIIPDVDLKQNTRYYVIVEGNYIKDPDNYKFKEAAVYFDTGSGDGGEISTSFRPADGSTGVDTDAVITINFSQNVVRQGNGSAINSSYLTESILFRKASVSGTDVPYTATVNSANKITITPKSSMERGQTYYVGIVGNKLKTESTGKTIPAKTVSWKVEGTLDNGTVTPPAASPAILSGLKVTADGNATNLLTGFSAAKADYNVEVPFGTAAVNLLPSAASSVEVKCDGLLVGSTGITISPSPQKTVVLNVSQPGKQNNAYIINVKVKGDTSLRTLSLNTKGYAVGGSNYSVSLSAGDTTLDFSVVSNDSNAVIKCGSSSGTGELSANVPIVGVHAVTFTITSNGSMETYTINISRLLDS